jgi:plasmid stabilization system protein ParE
MTYSFHPEAEAEFLGAVEFYEARRAGLGQDFAIEVYSAIQRIVSFPTAWPVLGGDVRRCLTNRFPYGVLYTLEPNGVFILAVMHLHRASGYWGDRR